MIMGINRRMVRNYDEHGNCIGYYYLAEYTGKYACYESEIVKIQEYLHDIHTFLDWVYHSQEEREGRIEKIHTSNVGKFFDDEFMDFYHRATSLNLSAREIIDIYEENYGRAELDDDSCIEFVDILEDIDVIDDKLVIVKNQDAYRKLGVDEKWMHTKGKERERENGR